MNRKPPIIIGIAGGTGSGKSTFTNRLKDAFGDQVTVLYHDNYYRAHDDMPFEQRKNLSRCIFCFFTERTFQTIQVERP